MIGEPNLPLLYISLISGGHRVPAALRSTRQVGTPQDEGKFPSEFVASSPTRSQEVWPLTPGTIAHFVLFRGDSGP